MRSVEAKQVENKQICPPRSLTEKIATCASVETENVMVNKVCLSFVYSFPLLKCFHAIYAFLPSVLRIPVTTLLVDRSLSINDL